MALFYRAQAALPSWPQSTFFLWFLTNRFKMCSLLNLILSNWTIFWSLRTRLFPTSISFCLCLIPGPRTTSFELPESKLFSGQNLTINPYSQDYNSSVELYSFGLLLYQLFTSVSLQDACKEYKKAKVWSPPSFQFIRRRSPLIFFVNPSLHVFLFSSFPKSFRCEMHITKIMEAKYWWHNNKRKHLWSIWWNQIMDILNLFVFSVL